MVKSRFNLENIVNAILDRDRGDSYVNVMERYDISANGFCKGVDKVLGELSLVGGEKVRKKLKEIREDDSRRTELFFMGEEFIREQYDRIQAREQSRFHFGTYFHPDNVINIVYYALTENNPNLKSKNRAKIINELKKLPSDLVDHFHRLGLRGLMNGSYKGEKRGSPLAVLE